nr:unnamed protein product [Callosobruchus chinensis]
MMARRLSREILTVFNLKSSV